VGDRDRGCDRDVPRDEQGHATIGRSEPDDEVRRAGGRATRDAVRRDPEREGEPVAQGDELRDRAIVALSRRDHVLEQRARVLRGEDVEHDTVGIEACERPARGGDDRRPPLDEDRSHLVLSRDVVEMDEDSVDRGDLGPPGTGGRERPRWVTGVALTEHLLEDLQRCGRGTAVAREVDEDLSSLPGDTGECLGHERGLPDPWRAGHDDDARRVG
jgi:hypothetical protein